MLIYKIVTSSIWQHAQDHGVLAGMPVDLADGYIHFSTVEQLRATAVKHFAGQRDLLLLSVEADLLGDALKWEVSRGGALFPHLYAPLLLHHVQHLVPLQTDAAGNQILPEFVP